MPTSVQAIIKPEMLVWARDSAGLSIDEAARKVNTTPNRIREWENGESKPSIKQLRKLGTAYHRPLAVFYLPKPPKDFDALRDFRRHPGTLAGSISTDLRYEIRHAANRRDIALELHEILEIEPPRFTLKANLSDNKEKLASLIRQYLKIDIKEQKKWSTKYESLNAFKLKFESAGILIFQTSLLKVEDARGFSISGSRLPAIIVNTKDTPSARIFTMFHELVHLALRINGICDLEIDDLPPEEKKIEIFCNHVAGAVLVPENHLLQEDIVRRKSVNEYWNNSELNSLAKQFSISREVILRRLLILNRTTPEIYEEKRAEFLEEYRSLSDLKKGGPVPIFRKVISQSGRLFTRLVLDNYYQDRITASDVSDFLGVKLKHLVKIEQEVY